MADEQKTQEKTRRGRGPSRPLSVRLHEAIQSEQKKVEYHQKHLDASTAELDRLEKVLEEHEKQEAETANERIAELEAEMKRLKALAKK